MLATLPLLVPMNRTSKALPERSLAPWCTAIFVKSSLEPDFTNTGVEGREGTAWGGDMEEEKGEEDNVYE